MKPIVLDCSVAIAWCFQDESTVYTDAILDYVRQHSAIVPALWLSEVTNVLTGAIRKHKLDVEGGLLFLENISKLPIRIANISSREFFTEVFPLAIDAKLTSYDAVYLYLAKRERIGLATIDSDLKAASRSLKLPKVIPK